jgi:molybdate transport system ATP-binding protein
VTLNVDASVANGDFRLEAKLEAPAGITVIFGRSGAGKSTLLSAIAGLVRPQRGHIQVDARVLFDSQSGIDVPVHHRRLGYVFQDACLLPHLSVRANLLYGYRFCPATERRIHLDQVCGVLALGDLLRRRTASLSGGERQRVAIGRALLSNPSMLLMDEPLASLDIARRTEIMDYIERLRAEFHIPAVYVSHSLDEVLRLADTLVLLDAGKVIASGKVTDLMRRPDLQAYTGGTDAGAVIEARVSEYDGSYDLTTLLFSGGRLLCAGVSAPIGQAVRIRVRARDVALALTEPRQTSVLNVLRGTITNIITEPTGEAVDVSISVGEAILYARVTRFSCDRLGLHAGKEVFALIKAVSLDRTVVGLP